MEEYEISQKIDSAISNWKQGLQLERQYFKPKALSSETYVEAICLKVEWLSLTSECLLKKTGQANRLNAFRYLYNLIICGMQSRDDALDFSEDRMLNCISYPEALGVTPGALYQAGTKLLKNAAFYAGQNGFHKLAEWLDKLLQTHNRPTFTEHDLIDRFGGWIISAEIENELRQKQPHEFDFV